jgi:hypothetical protein
MPQPCATDWELSKENIMPIKRGRSVKGLNEVLNTEKVKSNSEIIEEQEKYSTKIV